MGNDQDVSKVEQGGVGLSLILFGLAVMEFTGSIDIVPVHVYILVLFVVTVLLSVYRRREE